MQVSVDVKHTTKEAFKLAMELVFIDNCSWNSELRKEVFFCNGYSIKNNELFLSKYSDKCTLFPYKYNNDQTIEFAWGWLQHVKPSYNEPDTDGSTGLGFEITTKKSGVGSNDWGMFASISPIWMVYGK